MNFHNPTEFSKAFGAIDATDTEVADLPEEIRNLIDSDEWADLKSKSPGKWVYVEAGEIKEVQS